MITFDSINHFGIYYVFSAVAKIGLNILFFSIQHILIPYLKLHMIFRCWNCPSQRFYLTQLDWFSYHQVTLLFWIREILISTTGTHSGTDRAVTHEQCEHMSFWWVPVLKLDLKFLKVSKIRMGFLSFPILILRRLWVINSG